MPASPTGSTGSSSSTHCIEGEANVGGRPSSPSASFHHGHWIPWIPRSRVRCCTTVGLATRHPWPEVADMSSACEWEENNGSAAQPGQDGIRKGPITARGGGTLEAHGGLLRRMRSDAGIQEKLVRIGQVHGATCVRYRQRQCGEKDAILGRERRGIF